MGTNLGDRHENLRRARQELAGLPGIEVGAASPIYETEPLGVREQPWFLNQVVRLGVNETWNPAGLLRSLKHLEVVLGRQAGTRWGPRLIDLDLLLYDSEQIDTEELALPHPRMLERAFVLKPLYDLAPELIMPGGVGLAEALGRIDHEFRNGRIHQP